MRQSVVLLCFLFVLVNLDMANSFWRRRRHNCHCNCPPCRCNNYQNCKIIVWRKGKREVSKINVPCNFGLYDTNNDGKLLPEEFEENLMKLGFSDKLTLFKTLDGDSNGEVSEQEFYNEAVKQAKPMLFEECIGRKVN